MRYVSALQMQMRIEIHECRMNAADIVESIRYTYSEKQRGEGE